MKDLIGPAIVLLAIYAGFDEVLNSTNPWEPLIAMIMVAGLLGLLAR